MMTWTNSWRIGKITCPNRLELRNGIETQGTIRLFRRRGATTVNHTPCTWLLPKMKHFLSSPLRMVCKDGKRNLITLKPPKVVAEDGSEVAEDGAAVAETNNHNGLYTSTTTGQNQYGGWSEQGLHLFKQYVEMNIEARNHPNTGELEKTCLTKLRIKWGIQCDTAEEHNKQRARMKSLRKRGRGEEPMPPMKKVIRTMRMMQESSDEEYEEEED